MADDDGRVLAHAFDAEHPAGVDLDALLGGKGAGLVRMTRAGLAVPPGFTLTTDACRRYRDHGWSPAFDRAIETGLARLSSVTGRSLAPAGGAAGAVPLLVSVRSGARASMPGMMDSVLDVGMNDDAERRLAEVTGDVAFAADTHQRALCSHAEAVLRAPSDVVARARSLATPGDTRDELARHGLAMPSDPVEQVGRAVRAVFDSCDLARARRFRAIEGIAEADAATAATVQVMVFGNRGERSGTGVAFSRDPTTGARQLTGDFLVRAQGDDVVSGALVTESLAAMAERWPEQWGALVRAATQLERDHADMVDIEFTVEDGQLWLLQVRPGRRSPIAALRIAIDLAEDPDSPVDRSEAVRRCARHLDDPPRQPAPTGSREVTVASGLAASPGHGTGVLCLDPDEAVRLDAAGVDVVLARRETAPADVHGIAVARGLFTTGGGLVSHAAVVARSWGLPAVVGATETVIDEIGVHGPGGTIRVGELVTVDGDRGRLHAGGATARGPIAPEVAIVESWRRSIEILDGAVAAPDMTFDFAVLHALRVKGLATATAVGAMIDRPVERELAALARSGLATCIEARGLWHLSDAGRDHHRLSMGLRRAAVDVDASVYDDFLDVNVGFKELCTDWQVRDGVSNDHGDADYDATIFSRLAVLHDQAVALLVAMAPLVEIAPTVIYYRARLDAAVAAVHGGDHRRLTGVMCDSYHDIWMEWHEDLLVIHGIDRADEGST